MLKKTITYNDLDGNPITEDFYFNLTKAEIAEMELSHDGGLSAYLQRIVETKDGAVIIAAFKDILFKAYGRRSEDGKRFVKSPEISTEFTQTEAYSDLFMELVTNAEASAAFFRGVVPAGLTESGEKLVDLPSASEPKNEQPAWILESREPTGKELMTMSREQLVEAMRQKSLRSASENMGQSSQS